MGFFSNLFGGDGYSKKDMEVIGSMAQRIADVLNESLEIVEKSNNPETKISRLQVAIDKLEELKNLEQQYSFLTITSLPEIELIIEKFKYDIDNSGLQEIVDGNLSGQSLEKEGRIDDAISQYEALTNKGADTPFTYRRLAILYRKKKEKDDEVRILELALKNIPKSNAKHYEWFQDRLNKLISKT